MNHSKFIIFMIFACMSPSTFATEMSYASSVTNGFRNSARIAYTNPPEKDKQVTLEAGLISSNAKQILDDLFQQNNSKVLIAAQGSKIIYERYGSGTGRGDTPLGYSISKSLVALAVGRAICDRHIESIDDKLEKYVPALSKTSWGESSIRHILTMSSGAYRTTPQFNGHKNAEMDRTIGPNLYAGAMRSDFIDIMREADEKSFIAGKEFNYSNFDTIALGLLVQEATKSEFSKYFEKTIWADVGAKSKGGWVINNKSQISAYSGFSATPQDWLRIGIMVLRELKNTDTCFGNFIKQATTKQIDVRGPGPARMYGYQTWVQCRSSDFCFVGFGGQYLLFNIEENIVIYQHATTLSPIVRLTPSVMGPFIQGMKNP